jgi:hypothetical protein
VLGRGFAACFPLNVSIVYSLKLTFVANGNNLTSTGLAPGETICFGSLEFTTDRFGNLSLSPEGNDPGTVFVGMVHSGSLCLHTVLEESTDEGDTASGRGASSSFPSPQGCNVVTTTVPITTTSPQESTPLLLTIPTVQLLTALPQPGTMLLPMQQQAYQEEEQV